MATKILLAPPPRQGSVSSLQQRLQDTLLQPSVKGGHMRRVIGASSRQRIARTTAVAGAVAAIALPTVLAVPAAEADTPSGNYLRIRQCSNANKYGCQTYFVTLNGSPYGQFYAAYHTHACTANAGTAIEWKLEAQNIAFTRDPSQLSFSRSTGFMNANWCEGTIRVSYTASPSDQWWAYRGNNYFKISTYTRWGSFDQRCLNSITNLSVTGDYNVENVSNSCQDIV